jgi:hypothetical protein
VLPRILDFVRARLPPRPTRILYYCIISVEPLNRTVIVTDLLGKLYGIRYGTSASLDEKSLAEPTTIVPSLNGVHTSLPPFLQRSTGRPPCHAYTHEYIHHRQTDIHPEYLPSAEESG